MTDPCTLRAVTEDEFHGRARMIAEAHGVDRSDEEIASQRAATVLPRTVVAFDGDAPVGGASLCRRLLTVPGAIMPVAGAATVGVTPTHRRRGILTSMMRRPLTYLHVHGAEPIAVPCPAGAAVYGRYGHGPATQGNHLRCDKRGRLFRPGQTSATARSGSWAALRLALLWRRSTTRSGAARSAGPTGVPLTGRSVCSTSRTRAVGRLRCALPCIRSRTVSPPGTPCRARGRLLGRDRIRVTHHVTHHGHTA
ncbi:GNAT family N-acetyltransferase [Streptomyces sp. NPDC015125]|uniref:GNAT family N-acetyltransferase n=1 Tax=Streptomyces sp. NPDC015125 TaxID=3364938 RepID=UPI0036F8DFFC